MHLFQYLFVSYIKFYTNFRNLKTKLFTNSLCTRKMFNGDKSNFNTTENIILEVKRIMRILTCHVYYICYERTKRYHLVVG